MLREARRGAEYIHTRARPALLTALGSPGDLHPYVRQRAQWVGGASRLRGLQQSAAGISANGKAGLHRHGVYKCAQRGRVFFRIAPVSFDALCSRPAPRETGNHHSIIVFLPRDETANARGIRNDVHIGYKITRYPRLL